VTGAAEPRRTDRRDALLACLIAAGLLGLFVAAQRGRVPSYDGKIALATARAISEGRLHLEPADDFYKANLPYSHYGIGMPLVILPLYVLQRALQVQPNLLETMASPLLLASAAVLLYLSGRELGWSRRVSLAAALVFGALTMGLQLSQEVLSEPGVAFSTALVVLGMLRWRTGRWGGPWLAGVGVGSGILFRGDSALLLGVGLLLLPALVPWRRLLRERWAWLGLALPIIAALVWTGWYSMLRDGTVIPLVYGGSFRTPLLLGLDGLLLSHGKSLFVYNPFLLLAIPGAVLLWRRDWPATALLLVLVVARPLFYARWSDLFGGVTWGPRFLMPTAGPLSLLAVYAVSRIPLLHLALRVPAALVVAALVVAGGVVNVASVWVPYGAAWRWSTTAPADLHLEGAARESYVAARHHAFIYTLGSSAIAYNLRHITRDNRSFPLTHFRGGAEPIGIAGLAVAGVAPLAAWVLGRPRRRGPPEGDEPPPEPPPEAPAATTHEAGRDQP
jgi:4-amino-4-deoxy-L-arabinose transferase-like glycosyltransferase